MENTNNKKLWKINRIENLLEVYTQGLETHKEEFKTFSDFILQSFQDRQKNLMSVMAMVLSLIGLAASFLISSEQYIVYLAILLAIVLISLTITYIITNRIKDIIAEELWILQKTYHEAFVAMYFMKGLIDLRSSNLELMTYEQLDLLDKYYFIVEGSIVNQIIDKANDSLNKLEKTSLLRSYSQKWKKEVKVIPQLHFELLKKACEIYQKHSDLIHDKKIYELFEGYESIIKQLNKNFVEPFITKCPTLLKMQN